VGRVVLFAVGLLLSAMLAPAPAGARQAPPEAGSSDWRTVSAGGQHTCGIRTTGRLYCWGSNSDGQVGANSATFNFLTPVQVAGGATTWTAVVAGGVHACGIRTPGRLYCWGRDTYGQLGNGLQNQDRLSPFLVAGGITDWVAVTAGDHHTCGLRRNHRLYCWGHDIYGQLGNGAPNQDRFSPTLVAGGITDWASVSAGPYHTCGRRTSGRIYCWGNDEAGKLGNGGLNADRPIPTLVAGGITNWTSVSAGGSHTCGRRATGRIYCWGSDGSGELGDGEPLTDRSTPGLVGGGASPWIAVDASSGFTCGRRAPGRILCWGTDFGGALGDGGADEDRSFPYTVAGSATDWTAVSSNFSHTCAVTTARRLYCWGYGFAGELGNGGQANFDTPEEVFAP